LNFSQTFQNAKGRREERRGEERRGEERKERGK